MEGDTTMNKFRYIFNPAIEVDRKRMNDWWKKFYKENPEHIKKYSSDYYDEHREEYKAHSKKVYEENTKKK